MLVIRERTGRVETLTLNRPEAANSLNPPLMAELGTALHEILLDADVRAVVVTGAGERIFCAGMDLTALGEFGGDPAARSRSRREPPRWPASSTATTRSRSIAAVNGAAVGGGLEMVMACDLVVAAEHARFGLPEVKRGLYAAGGGTRLSQRIPQALALEMGLTGRLVGAERAAQFGLVNQVVPAGELLGAAHALATEVAANGPLGVQTDQAPDAPGRGPGLGGRAGHPRGERRHLRERGRRRGCDRVPGEAGRRSSEGR